MLPAGHRSAASWVHYTTSCNTQSSAPEDGKNNFPKHVELTGIINKPLLLNIVGCLYYLYQWCTVKQISDNEIYLLIKYTKNLLWRAAKRLSYIEDAWCLKVKHGINIQSQQKTTKWGALWYVLLTQYRSGDQIKKNEMGGACSTYRRRRGVYRVLVGKPAGKRSFGRPRRKWVNNIKMDLQEVGDVGV